MKVLMVGSGAVGQVLGLGLRKANVDLAFYARPGSGARLTQALEQGGLPLFQTSHLRRRHPIAHRLSDYQVVTDLEGCQRFEPDQIWFTTPSTVCHSQWFQEFLLNVPSDRVVCFAPEGGRDEFYPKVGDKGRMVFGGIMFLAWQGDLGGDAGRPEGVGFWLPPLLEIPLMGEQDACHEVADLLKNGGFRSTVKEPGFGKIQAATAGVLSGFVAGLELSGWSLRLYRRSPWLRVAARGCREAVLSQLPDLGSAGTMLLTAGLSRAGLSLATVLLPVLFPFDLEKYVKFHYLKTREQTLTLLDLFASDGERRGVPVDNIQGLVGGLLESA
jgi:2-dehydropantoate 2-reductase